MKGAKVFKPDAEFERAVTEAVAAAEQRTDAEIIVVVAEQSGSYRDIAYAAASAATLVALVGVLFAPWSFTPAWIPLELAAAWVFFAWVSDQPWVARALTSTRRRHAQIDDAARAEFVDEAIHGTPNRTGVLVYVSLLEREVRVLPDLGAEGRIPPAEWNMIRQKWTIGDAAAFLGGLHRLADVLAARIPHLATSDDFDLGNAPRIRR